MNKHLNYILFVLLLCAFCACKSKKQVIDSQSTILQDDGKITFQFLQMNDVYEIAPLENGKVGGLARVAALRKRLINDNPNLLTVLAGDFLSPSLMGTIKHGDKRLRGKQMVDIMNYVGVDLVTFGNHEFDIKQAELQERINESEFLWLGTSVRDINLSTKQTGKFTKYTDSTNIEMPDTWIWQIQDKDGTKIKVGFFGATIPSNPKDYVEYLDYEARALESVQELSSQTDIIIGLTHLDEVEDIALAKKIQQVPLIMGGHDHHHMRHIVGKSVVAKADANAKTVYIHTLTYNRQTQQTQLSSELVPITSDLPSNDVVRERVKKWQRIQDDAIYKVTPEPYSVIHTANAPLEAREKFLRHEQVNTGRIVNEAMSSAAQQKVDCSFFNSGSIRIDDQLEGDIIAMDIFRLLPFGGGLVEADITGDRLIKVMKESEMRKGKGAYLQKSKIWYSETQAAWVINGEPIEKDKLYHIITTDFLMKGLDLKTLKDGLPGVTNVTHPNKEDKKDLRNNIVIAVIEYMKSLEN